MFRKPEPSPAPQSPSLTIDDLFPSKWMKASDLKGQDLTLEIDHIEHMPVGREQELAGVLFWTDALFKPLIMNKTNGRKIGEKFGPALDDWVGQKITLYAVEVNTPDGPKMGIRVR